MTLFKLNSHTPVAQNVKDEVVFNVSKAKESFFSDLTEPPQIFDAHLLENTNISPSSFHFSVGFISRSVLSQMVL